MFLNKLLRQTGWSRALIFLLVVWFIFIVIAFTLLRHDNDSQTVQRLNQAFKELQLLQQQRSEVSQLLEIYINGCGSHHHNTTMDADPRTTASHDSAARLVVPLQAAAVKRLGCFFYNIQILFGHVMPNYPQPNTYEADTDDKCVIFPVDDDEYNKGPAASKLSKASI